MIKIVYRLEEKGRVDGSWEREEVRRYLRKVPKIDLIKLNSIWINDESCARTGYPMKRKGFMPYPKAFYTVSGYYKPKIKRIVITASSLSDGWTLIHELGHHVYDWLMCHSQRLEWDMVYSTFDLEYIEWPSEYAKRNTGEFFAECYAIYYIKRKEFKKKFPRLVELFDKNYLERGYNND